MKTLLNGIRRVLPGARPLLSCLLSGMLGPLKSLGKQIVDTP